MLYNPHFMNQIVLIFAIFLINLVQALTFKEKILQGHAGDYAVLCYANNYTILSIRSLDENKITLDEVSINEEIPKQNGLAWNLWMEKGAPGALAWNTYEIDLKTTQLLRCYSHTQKSWLPSDDPNQFLPKLLSIHLTPTPPPDRKKIGPPPLQGETDTRSFWIPPVTIQGKKVQKPHVYPWQGTWPKDDSLLSECKLELYFETSPFPVWIDVKSPHYTASMRAVDAGCNLKSIAPKPPLQAPQFSFKPEWNENILEFQFKWSDTSPNLGLYALDVTESSVPLFIPCHIDRKKESATLKVKKTVLDRLFVKGHRYQWLIVVQDSDGIASESPDVFTWPGK